MDSMLRDLHPDDAKAHGLCLHAAIELGEWGTAAVLVARLLVLRGLTHWPAGGARELLECRPDLWKETFYEEAVASYLGLGRPKFTDPNDDETADVESILETYADMRGSRQRAWEGHTHGHDF